jgi:fluoride exporter
MGPTSFIAVGVGAALGAWLRWGLSAWLNERQTLIPLGTLASNLIGGYLVGVAVAWLMLHPEVDPRWRLFLVTGCLGGLTTFSTYSAEVTGLLLRGEWWQGALVAVAHLAGSLMLTALGIWTVQAMNR